MATDNEIGLKAVLEPQVDERAADSEVDDLKDKFDGIEISPSMPDISDLIPDLDQMRSGLGRAAGRGVGKMLPGKIGSGVGGILGEQLAGGGGGGSTSPGGSPREMDLERNELLESIEEHLDPEQINGKRGGGGGGGGGLGAGLMTKLKGGAGGSAGTILAALGIAGAGIGGARHAMGQGFFGKEGEKTLAGRRKFEGISGLKNAMDNPGEAMATGFLNTIDPTGIGETMARKAANDLMAQTTFDERVKEGFDLGVQVWKEELNSFEWPEVPEFDIPSKIDLDKPQFLEDMGVQSQDKEKMFGGRFKGGFQNPATGQREDLGTGAEFTVDNTFNFNLDNIEKQLDEVQDNAVTQAVDEIRQELDRRLSNLTGGFP